MSRRIASSWADVAGAARLVADLRHMLQLAPETSNRQPPILETVATDGRGIDELLGAVHPLPGLDRALDGRVDDLGRAHTLGQRAPGG